MKPASPIERLTWRNVAALRLHHQYLDHRVPAGSIVQVVGDLCGLHAQLLSSAELALWTRVHGLVRGELSDALWKSRALVKAWAMRGTLHVVPAADYPLWQAGLGTYDHYLKGAWFRYFGLSREELDLLTEAISRALYGAILTRQELIERVGELTGSDELAGKLSDSWGAVLKPASFQGALCFAPSSGRNVRFTHPQSWLEPGYTTAGDQALTDITRRFLASNGPATREDYARWWGISPATAQARITALGDKVVEVQVEDEAMWMLAGHVAEAATAEPEDTVNLLPGFDQYVIAATRHASHLIAGDNRARIYRPQGWISPVVLVDGRMRGTWSHESKGSRLKVEVQPFGPLPEWVIVAIRAEAQYLAQFFGCTDLELTL